MTLEEAIKHAEEVAEEKENEGKLLCQSEGASIGCLTCAEEHRQLAEWLRELKRNRDVLQEIRNEIENLTIARVDDDYVRKMAGLFIVKREIMAIIDKHIGDKE